jgi:hypothetical protein
MEFPFTVSGVVVIFVVVTIFLAVVLFFLVFVWLLAKETMGSRKVWDEVFQAYFAHAQWYASCPLGRFIAHGSGEAAWR